ncbi:MAG: YybH family protein [Gemmataceae bacterium]
MTPEPRRAFRGLFFLVFFAGLLGGYFLSGFGLRSVTTDETRIQQLIQEQETAWNAGQLEGFMKSYAMSETTSMYSGGEIRQGWVTIHDRYRQTYQLGGRSMGKLKFSDVQVERISSSAALARGKWEVELPEKTAKGLFTLVWKRNNGEWQIVHDHTSAAP